MSFLTLLAATMVAIGGYFYVRRRGARKRRETASS
jgi:LPXTG-motif cell wall-anchored protein